MELTLTEELLAAAVLTLQIATVIAVGTLAAQTWSPHDRLVAWLEGTLVAIATAVAIPLGLAMCGVVSRLPVATVHALILVAVVAALVRRARSAPGGSESKAMTRPDAIVILAAFGAGVVFAVGALLALGPPSGDTDTREYHVTNMATWLREGEIWTLPYQSPAGVTATHPGNFEMVALWLTVPSHGDELAYAAPLPFALLAVLGSALLARELSGDRVLANRRAALGALAGATVITVPFLVITQLGSLTNDLSVAATVVATLGLVAFANRTGDRSTIFAAGIALGLGVGAKYTALVPMAVVTLAALWLLRRRAWWCLAPGLIALAAPWYLRNLFATGNPLFPQPIGPLAGGESPLLVIDTPMLGHLLPPDWTILRAAAPHAARRLGPVLVLAALGTLLLAWSSLRHRLSRVVAAVTLAALLGYLATPFSGGGPAGLLFLIVSSFRYAIVFLLLATVALVALAPIRWALVGVVPVLAWNLVRLLEIPEDRADVSFTGRHLALVLAVGALAAVAAAGVVWIRDMTSGRARALLVAATVVVLAATSVGYHRYDRGLVLQPLERAMLSFGPQEPVVVLGVLDLRSLLGPRLERPLMGVSRGGEVGEVSFVDEAQIRRLLGGEADAPDTETDLGAALDAALQAADSELLVVGPLGDFSYPDGWTPDAAWCAVERVGAITLYASTSSPLAAAHCSAQAST